jgi:hypothetical protein
MPFVCMKKGLAVGFLLVILSISIFSFIAAQEPSDEVFYGPQWNTICENGICNTTIYSYEKYWLNGNGDYEEIDESWHTCDAGYCTNNYHFNVQANNNGDVVSFRDGESVNFRLSGLLNYSLDLSNPVIEGSVLTYEDVVPEFIDVRYQYLPRKLKEDIILKQPLPIDGDFDIIFDRNGDADFDIPTSIICDSAEACEEINHEIGSDRFTLNIPFDFLNDPEREYPVFIDPTLKLNDSDIAWNGIVTENDTLCFSIPCWKRGSNPASLNLGEGSSSIRASRGDIDWNVSAVPDSVDVTSVKLGVFIEQAPTGLDSTFLNATHMEGNNSDYPNTDGNCQGNCNFYNDMGNGTVFASEGSLSGSNFSKILTFNSDGKQEVENSLPSDIFSVGLDTDLDEKLVISGRDNANASRRPELQIIYDINSSSSDEAIEEGINDSLPNNSITSAHQIYLVNETEGHFLGTFDKSTIKNNQTWAFNYISFGESAIGMPSLFNILNIWENNSLTYVEIVGSVGLFINNTII